MSPKTKAWVDKYVELYRKDFTKWLANLRKEEAYKLRVRRRTKTKATIP